MCPVFIVIDSNDLCVVELILSSVLNQLGQFGWHLKQLNMPLISEHPVHLLLIPMIIFLVRLYFCAWCKLRLMLNELHFHLRFLKALFLMIMIVQKTVRQRCLILNLQVGVLWLPRPFYGRIGKFLVGLMFLVISYSPSFGQYGRVRGYVFPFFPFFSQFYSHFPCHLTATQSDSCLVWWLLCLPFFLSLYIILSIVYMIISAGYAWCNCVPDSRLSLIQEKFIEIYSNWAQHISCACSLRWGLSAHREGWCMHVCHPASPVNVIWSLFEDWIP